MSFSNEKQEIFAEFQRLLNDEKGWQLQQEQVCIFIKKC